MRGLQRVLAEPLLHFLLIGAGLFALYAALNPAGEADADAAAAARANTILVSPALAQQLATRYSAVWQRPPTVEILDGLIDNHIREEVLVREARALSLDEGDTVVRQRLAQKMAFLGDAEAAALEPDEATLTAFRDKHAERYRRPPRATFEQVYLGEAPEEAQIEAVRTRLNEGEAPANVATRSLLPASVPGATAAQVDGTFGRGTFAAIEALPAGEWAGPVATSFGAHLVRLSHLAEGTDPPLDEIRDSVERDYIEEQKRAMALARLDALLARYDVRRPSREALDALLP